MLVHLQVGSAVLQLGCGSGALLLLNNTNDSFSLSPNRTLVTARVLGGRDYVLTVVGQEEVGIVPIAVVWIAVADNNASQEHTVLVREDQPIGSFIIKVNAAPAVTGTVYSITAGSNGEFAINRTSGIITLLSPLDYEGRNSYQLVVVAAGTSFNAQITVNIVVTDVNEPPTFSSQTLSLGVTNMTAALGVVVGYILATDGDSPSTSNGTLRYSTNSVSVHTVQLLLRYSPPSFPRII